MIGGDETRTTSNHNLLKRINLARFDLVSIRLVVFCADHRNLACAARMAHMTKSTASHRLANFEKKLKLQLFVREPAGLQPTMAGSLLADHGRSILANIDDLCNNIADLEVVDFASAEARED